MGKTCVVAESPGLIDYVQACDDVILYDPSNPDDLASKIREAIAQTEARGSERNSRSWVEKNFSTKSEARRLWEIIGRRLS